MALELGWSQNISGGKTQATRFNSASAEGSLRWGHFPDGSQFAVVRCVAIEQTLEFPIGKFLYRTNGYIIHVRIAPQGDIVAFYDHPVLGDDLGARRDGRARRQVVPGSPRSGVAEGLKSSLRIFCREVATTVFSRLFL